MIFALIGGGLAIFLAFAMLMTGYYALQVLWYYRIPVMIFYVFTYFQWGWFGG